MFGNLRSRSQYTALSGTGETTIVTADAATRNQLVGLIITTTNAAAGTLTLRDSTAGTTRSVLNFPNAALAPAGPLILTFDPPLDPTSTNANWTLQASVNASGYNVTAIYVKEQ